MLLITARRLPATVENARLLISERLSNLRRPQFSFDTLQVVFAKRYNYVTKQYDLLGFFSVYPTDDPKLNPADFQFCLDWSEKTGWVIVSEQHFNEFYA